MVTVAVCGKNRSCRIQAAAWGVAMLAVLLALPVRAGMNDLRITEVDPWHEKIEVTYFGTDPLFLSTQVPIPYNFDVNNFKQMGIVPGFYFVTNTVFTFDIPDMYTSGSDCWLYSSESYNSPGALIHGVQFGWPPPEKTTSEVATAAGKWTGKYACAPLPPQGCTLAWDGDGFTPLDWYVCAKPTMGALNNTVDGAVNDKTFQGPNASQSFETGPLGDQVSALSGWSMSGGNRRFNVRFVNNVNGTAGVRPGSTSSKWLRIRDTDPDSDDNSFASPPVALDAIQSGYTFSFYVNQEVAPTATGVQPTLTIQNDDGSGGWADAWGIRFRNDGIDAAVLDGGGFPNSASLTYLTAPTGIGQWVRIDLQLDLANGQLSASATGAAPVQMPISPGGNPLRLRLAYQGGGAGNTQDVLLDDLSLAPYTPIRNGIRGWEGYR